MPEAVIVLTRTLDLPKLRRESWPQMFEVIARYAAQHDFSLSEATRWTRDELAREGLAIGRPAVEYVVRGTQSGGAPLNRQPPPSADEIGEAFWDSLIERARFNGVDLDAAAEADIADWLGLPPEEDAPETPAAEASRAGAPS